MRKAFMAIVGTVGLLVVFVASAYVSARIRAHYGFAATLVMALAFTAAWVATPESRAMAAKVLASLRRLGWSLKEAAYRARMTEAQLSAQLSGREIMQLSRYAEWGPAWECAFALELLPPTGLWIENQELADILRPLTQRERAEGAA